MRTNKERTSLIFETPEEQIELGIMLEAGLIMIEGYDSEKNPILKIQTDPEQYKLANERFDKLVNAYINSLKKKIK